MAFQLPSGPVPFNVQTPDVLGGQARAATLSGLLSENALRNQLAPLQVQEQQEKAKQAQIATQLQQIALQDSQALSKLFTEGDVNEDVPVTKSQLYDQIAAYSGMDPSDPAMGLLRNLAKHGMSGNGLMAQATSIIQRRKENAQATDEQRKIIKDNYDTWKDGTAQLYNADPKDQSIMLAQMLPRLAAATHLSPELDTAVQHLRQNGVQAIPEVYNLVAAQDKALGLSTAASKAITEAQKIVPQGIVEAAQKLGLSPDAAQKLQSDILIATNPQIQKGKVEVARAEGIAKAQIAEAMEPIRLQIQQQFANQKDARDKIETSVLKPFQDKMTDVTMARNAIAQAPDNPVAARAAVFKMVGVAQPTGSHRVLPMEFTAFKYPGGIADQVKEHFNDFLTGSPWTPDIAAAANAFIDGQAQAAQQNLNSGVDNVNKLYTTNVGQGLKTEVKPPPGAKTYTQADVDAAVAAGHGTAEQIEAAFKAKRYTKR